MSESTNKPNQSEVVLSLPDKINVEVGYGESHIRFYLKMISVLEETEHLARFATTPDDPELKAKAEYAILVDTIASWSYKAPTVRGKDAKGLPATGDLVPGATTARDAIESFFGEYNMVYERLLNTVLVRHRMGISPDSDFF